MRKFSRWVRNRWKCWHLIRGRISGTDKWLLVSLHSAVKKLIMVWWQPWDTICNFSFSQLPFHGDGWDQCHLPELWFRPGALPGGHCRLHREILMGFSHQASQEAQNNHSSPMFLLNSTKPWPAFKGGFFGKGLYSNLFTLWSEFPAHHFEEMWFPLTKTDGKYMECTHYL